MKKHLFAIAAITIAFISCGPVYVVQSSPQTSPQDEAPEITYQTFYDDLSPYGQWIDYPDYGYVWMPNAGPSFRPYATNGQWVYTDDGWAWSSGYNWGWATFHYGRWFFDANYGWMWMPGYQWAPAWVSWRSSNDYYGWAPLGPRINVDVAISNYNPPANYWCFVPHQYVSSSSVSNYYVNESRNTTIINNTTVINNNYTVNNNNTTNNRTTVNNNGRNNFVSGPDPREVSRFTGSTVTPAIIRQSTSHSERFNNGQLEIYHPRVNSNNSNNNAGNNNSQQQQHVAPTHFVPLSNARPFNRPGNNTNNTPANTNNNPNRPNNNQNQQPVNNTNNNPANTNNNPNRPNNNQNQQPVNNTNNNPANTNNNPNRNNNNPNNRNQNNKPANNQTQQNPNNNGSTQNRNNRFNRQQQDTSRSNKNSRKPKDQQ
ncbi:MAG TPA: DUF6600 domain-containing protein [Puia sp.]|nr:DUF6600 domain-containing protein [Puia sp.]